MNIKTVPYKGSKRKLLSDISDIVKYYGIETVFDGFSGTGIVSAFLRSKNYCIQGNDISPSSCLYGHVFLEGFDPSIVEKHLLIINESLVLKSGWLTENYSGEVRREVRGSRHGQEIRPRGFTLENAQIIDAARDYVENCELKKNEKNALIFSIILAANKVFNNGADQKSAFKIWSPASKRRVHFDPPTLISGPMGEQLCGDVFTIKTEAELVYLDPPYTNGVLYPACYHLNDSLALWDKGTVDASYAIPRPMRACFKKGQKLPFYSKSTAKETFEKLLANFQKSKVVVVSYSDAPRNSISLNDLKRVCKKFGKLKIKRKSHSLCSQPKSMKKISNDLNEYFLIIET